MTELNKISDTVDQKIGMFDQRQKRSLNAILDEWSEGGEDEFIFPIIDGPPGTGKTTLGTTAIAKYLIENRKGQIVYMCYTNYATAKAQESLFELNLSTDKVIRLTPYQKQTNWTRGIVGCTYNLSNLSHDDKRRLKDTSILLCTLHSSRRAFDLRRKRPRIIIDEFSQVTPPMFFSTLKKIRSAQLIPGGYAMLGDPLQLPIITTQPLLRPNIARFIMRRKPYRPHELDTQYRMHEDICECVNSLRKALYAPPLKTAKEVQDRTLLEVDSKYNWDKKSISDEKLVEIVDPEYPFVIVDTDGLGDNSLEEVAFGGSKRNVAEAELAIRLAKSFHDSYADETGKHLKPIILSPYSAQVGYIKRKLTSGFNIGDCITIHKSQGREYPCVIVSFVRNNIKGLIGFLKDPSLRAQTYVACSRAKAKLIVLLSEKTFIGHGHIDFEYLYDTKSAHKVKVG